ncbi:M20/M25/M40 family metallo-hydrolase [Rothia nasimurium]|uniref:M20/M25/M40 family metallo-hydrolase n=1 Tax=Rothia nasimurium TaxID=85336 RepID=UPI001F2C8A74|nr:M20/M25/M40 family metallo-hydrolase [Rothia nasimurium]
MSTPASLPWIEKLIAAPSISQTSNRPVLDLLAAEFEKYGLTPHYTYSEDGERANLFVTVPAADGSTDGGVVLSGHTDVVPVEGQAWTVTTPFTPLVKDGKLYGRGASDMKSFIGSAMWLLPQLREAELVKPVHFAFSYDEEIGCVGAPAMVRDFKARGINPDFAVIGEPSMMKVISAHKGAHRGRVTFTGIAKHASLGPHGVNALAPAAEFITFFEQLAGHWRENGPFDEGFVVAHSTGGVNFARGGIQYNIVGEHVVLEYDFRTVPQMTTGEVIAQIEAKISDDLLPALKARAADAEALAGAASGEFVDAVGITHELLAAVPALGTPDGAKIIALANGWAGRPGSTEAQKVTYGTEAGQFALYGELQAVVCGPGDIAQAHTPNEWIELAQIEACDRFMLKVLEWASQE